MLAKTEFTTLVETNTVCVQLDSISYELSSVTWFHCPSKVMDQQHEIHMTPHYEKGQMMCLL